MKTIALLIVSALLVGFGASMVAAGVTQHDSVDTILGVLIILAGGIGVLIGCVAEW